jgi:hypothetical protein
MIFVFIRSCFCSHQHFPLFVFGSVHSLSFCALFSFLFSTLTLLRFWLLCSVSFFYFLCSFWFLAFLIPIAISHFICGIAAFQRWILNFEWHHVARVMSVNPRTASTDISILVRKGPDASGTQNDSHCADPSPLHRSPAQRAYIPRVAGGLSPTWTNRRQIPATAGWPVISLSKLLIWSFFCPR